VQVDPINPALKSPGTKRLKLKYDEPPSNFAFQFNLRRYSEAGAGSDVEIRSGGDSRTGSAGSDGSLAGYGGGGGGGGGRPTSAGAKRGAPVVSAPGPRVSGGGGWTRPVSGEARGTRAPPVVSAPGPRLSVAGGPTRPASGGRIRPTSAGRDGPRPPPLKRESSGGGRYVSGAPPTTKAVAPRVAGQVPAVGLAAGGAGAPRSSSSQTAVASRVDTGLRAGASAAGAARGPSAGPVRPPRLAGGSKPAGASAR